MDGWVGMGYTKLSRTHGKSTDYILSIINISSQLSISSQELNSISSQELHGLYLLLETAMESDLSSQLYLLNCTFSGLCLETPGELSSCKANEFSCGDGKCIPDLWECDGINDCENKMDETNEGCRLKVLTFIKADETTAGV
jgi:hypothetical protein